MESWVASVENSLVVLQKGKHRISISVTPFLGIYPKELKTYVQTKAYP